MYETFIGWWVASQLQNNLPIIPSRSRFVFGVVVHPDFIYVMESRRRRKPFRCWYTRVPSGQLSILSSTLFSVTLRRRETPLHAPSSTTFTLNSKLAEESFIFLIVPICSGRYRLKFYLLVVSLAFQAVYARNGLVALVVLLYFAFRFSW